MPATTTEAAPAATPAPSKRVTCRGAVVAWLLARMEGRPYIVVYSHEVERQLPGWAHRRFGKFHTPGTWSRRFREARELGDVAAAGLEMTEVMHLARTAEGLWIVFRAEPDSRAEAAAFRASLQARMARTNADASTTASATSSPLD